MSATAYAFRLPASPDGAFHDPDLQGMGHLLLQSLASELETHIRAVERRPPNAEELAVLLSAVPGYAALLNRRAALGRLSLSLHEAPSGEVRLDIAPAEAVEVLAGEEGAAYLGPFLAQCLDRLFRAEGRLPEDAGPLVWGGGASLPQAATAGPRRRRDAMDLNERGGGWMRKLGFALVAVPMLMAGIVLFMVWSWMSEIRGDYAELRNTVQVHKEQIIDAVEEGVRRSVEVRDLYDAVKDAGLWDRLEGRKDGENEKPEERTGE